MPRGKVAGVQGSGPCRNSCWNLAITIPALLDSVVVVLGAAMMLGVLDLSACWYLITCYWLKYYSLAYFLESMAFLVPFRHFLQECMYIFLRTQKQLCVYQMNDNFLAGISFE